MTTPKPVDSITDAFDPNRPFSLRRVTPTWMDELPCQQQSVILLGSRGPDGIRKDHPCKDVVRAYRGTLFRAAWFGRWLAPGERVDDFMSLREIVDADMWSDVVKLYLRSVDELPHHYHLHLMHGAQILGFKHPDPLIRPGWATFYAACCDDMHLPIETEEVMDARLSDWGQKHWTAVIAPTPVSPATADAGGDWTEPTKWMDRFQLALSRLCGGAWPDADLCGRWTSHESEELQQWACSNAPAWAQGVATIEAAEYMADHPTEGVDHEMRPKLAAHPVAEASTAPSDAGESKAEEVSDEEIEDALETFHSHFETGSGSEPFEGMRAVLEGDRRRATQAAPQPAPLASQGVGKWLSAALNDPTVCAEMKADIKVWFEAGEPLPQLAQSEPVADFNAWWNGDPTVFGTDEELARSAWHAGRTSVAHPPQSADARVAKDAVNILQEELGRRYGLKPSATACAEMLRAALTKEPRS